MSGTRITTWVSLYQRQQLEDFAKQRGLSVSALVKSILENYCLVPEVQGTFSVSNEREEKEKKVAVKVMLKPSEFEAINQCCQKMGKTRQEFLISILRLYLANELLFDKKELDALIESNHELRKIGVNLNQITRSINSDRKSGKIPSQHYEEVLAMKDSLTKEIDTNVRNVRQLLEGSSVRCQLKG